MRSSLSHVCYSEVLLHWDQQGFVCVVVVVVLGFFVCLGFLLASSCSGFALLLDSVPVWHVLVLLSIQRDMQTDYLKPQNKTGNRTRKTLHIKVIEVILTICKYVFIVCRGWDVPASPTAVAHRNNDGLYIMVLWWFFTLYTNKFSLQFFRALELTFSLSSFQHR